jgi:hypothetical protein
MQEANRRIANWIKTGDPSKYLNLGRLNLITLPEIPSNCETLWCNGNQLTALPALPNCQILYCYDNKLTALPRLPNCKILDCRGNQLTVLTELPNCERLDCCRNKLIVLPELPNCKILRCYDNQLTVLPELPECETLDCFSVFFPCGYLWITKQQSRKYRIEATPNYTKFVKVIQRNYRKYIIRKYKPLDKYLLRDTVKVVYLYI